MKEKGEEQKPSRTFDFLVKCGVDEQVALEMDSYNQRKEKKRKRRQHEKEDKWK